MILLETLGLIIDQRVRRGRLLVDNVVEEDVIGDRPLRSHRAEKRVRLLEVRRPNPSSARIVVHVDEASVAHVARVDF